MAEEREEILMRYHEEGEKVEEEEGEEVPIEERADGDCRPEYIHLDELDLGAMEEV